MSGFVAVRYSFNVNATQVLLQKNSDEVGSRVVSSVKITIWDIYLRAYDRHYSVEFADSILDAEMQSSFVQGIKVFGNFGHLYTGKIKRGDTIELYQSDKHDAIWNASTQHSRYPIDQQGMTIGYVEVLYSDAEFAANITRSLIVDISQVAVISLLFILILYIVLRRTLVSPLQSMEVAHRALSSLDEAVFVLNKQGVLIDSNPSYIKMIENSNKDESEHSPPLSAKEYPQCSVKDLVEQQHGHNWMGEVTATRNDGGQFPGWLNVHKVISRDKSVTYVGVLKDVTEKQAAQEKLHHLAYCDTLTHVFNRHAFMQDLERDMRQATRDNGHIALLYIDLDKFKWVNDSFGHQVGDQLLIRLCQRFTKELREWDTLYRIGGDEFTIIVQDYNNVQALTAFAHRLIEIASEVFVLEKHHIRTGISIGISSYPNDAQTAEALIRHSDSAMFQAKMQGRGKLCFFSSKLDQRRVKEQQIVQELGEAVSAGEFELFLQPKVSLNCKDFSTKSAEALLRWRRDGSVVCPPDVFIPIAEQNNLICYIGYWVIEQACKILQTWRQEQYKAISIAVNLSPKQLQDSKLYSFLQDSILRYDICHGELEIEITESAVIEDISRSIETLQRIRSLGITISMDDFGTGYSSLGYLKQLPIDVLKIDRSFINKVPKDEDDVAIVLAIFSMAKALGISVVAEGIETKEQLDFLVEYGCETGQGYYFSQPVPVAVFQQWLLDN
jgi:diguanylate cyclase (GGDEF)-like protein/PAS domain S-box-containing protein